MTKFKKKKNQSSSFPDNRTIYSPTYQDVNHVWANRKTRREKEKERERNKTKNSIKKEALRAQAQKSGRKSEKS